MATKAKDAPPKNEKKAIPITSSNPHPFNRQGSSKSTTSRLSSNKQTLLATSPGKSTSNHLKPPTLGSKPETTLEYNKKSPSGYREDTSSNQNPTLLRRRSIDKVPSTSRTQNFPISLDPKERATSRVKATPLKSSSLSSNKPISITHKPGASKPFKPAQKSQPPGSCSRALKRNSSASRKNGTSTAPVSLSSSPTDTDKIAQSFDVKVIQSETNIETPAYDEAEEVHQFSPDVLEHDNEHLTVVNSQVCSAEDEKLGPYEVPATSESEEEVVHQDILVEETQSELMHNKEMEVENQSEGEEDHPKEGSPNEARKLEFDHNKEEENGIDGSNNVFSEQVATEENKQEDVDNVDSKESDKEVQSSREGIEANEDANEIETPAPPHEAVVSAQKSSVGQGKKEHPTAYNDVIEETKNKLLEVRKNKVKALVGAFETVIDYESSSR